MRLPKLKAGTRILGSFFIVLAVIAVISIVAVWRMHAADVTARDLVDDKLARQQQASELLGLAQLNGLRVMSIARSDSLELADLYKEQLAQGEKKTAEIAARLAAWPMSAKEKSLLEEASRRKTELAAIQEEVFRAKDMGRIMEVDELLGSKLEPAFKRYADAAEALLDAQARQAKELANRSASASAASRNLVAALGIAALTAGCLLAWRLTRDIVAPLQQAVELAEQVASGDLQASISHARGDEIGRLFDALNRMTSTMSGTLARVLDGAAAVDRASADIEAGNLDLSARTERQSGALEQTAASMEELTVTVRQNSDSAGKANRLAQSASVVAVAGGDAVAQMVLKMEAIKLSADKISDITGVIDGIAFQTNILALNAAVEAARAGEEGRGFAVVAGEVRALAQRSAAAAKDIKKLIGESASEIEAGAGLAATAGSTMREIVDNVRQLSAIMTAIDSASVEQAAGIGEVGQAIAELDGVTRQNAALVDQAAVAAASLRTQAQHLSQLVRTFRVGEAGALPPPATAQALPMRAAQRHALAA